MLAKKITKVKDILTTDGVDHMTVVVRTLMRKRRHKELSQVSLYCSCYKSLVSGNTAGTEGNDLFH